MCWTENLALDELLAAADLVARSRAGQEIPAWSEPSPSVATRDRDQVQSETRSRPAGPPPGQPHPAEDPPADDPPADDPLADDELRAAESAAGPAMPTAELAGQMRIPPGPALAAWLGQAQPATLDDAGLVNSIAGWRKVTSWAQAQELAAVAEIARRRGVTDDPSLDRDPARELEAEFAPNEIALALTLTQFAAEYWVSLAVSLSGRLPATFSAMRSGLIDLSRAKLIDQYTTPLDDDLAQAVERKVLPRAPRQTTTQLAASLRRAVMSVDPTAAERRRKEAERHSRVELTGDDAGTAALYGRLLPAAQASAAWARISAMATTLQIRGAGGGIDLLRAQVFIGLLLGTLPQPPDVPGPGDPAGPAPSADPGNGGDSGGGDGSGSGPEPESAATGSDTSDPGAPGSHMPGVRSDSTNQAPPVGDPGLGGVAWCWPHIPGPGEVPGFVVPASGTRDGRPALAVPWRTLAGLSGEPGQLTRIGAITAETAGDLAQVAAADPVCEWRILVTDRVGRLLTVTRIRSPGRGRASPRPRGSPAPTDRLGSMAPPHPRPRSGVLGRITVTVPVTILGEPPPLASAETATGPPDTALQVALTKALAAARQAVHPLDHRDPADPAHPGDPVHPAGPADPGAACRHQDSAAGYRIPGRLRALVEARDQHCRYPICRRPAAQCDLDHTVPYDQGGLTCRCNLSAGCRRHHRMKTLTSWRLRQPRPGTLIWTAPSRLAWTTSPEPYPV
ncbi:MAG TPA: DUF222 domain-containing protein [Streptosporangiaceae bacterium]